MFFFYINCLFTKSNTYALSITIPYEYPPHKNIYFLLIIEGKYDFGNNKLFGIYIEYLF